MTDYRDAPEATDAFHGADLPGRRQGPRVGPGRVVWVASAMGAVAILLVTGRQISSPTSLYSNAPAITGDRDARTAGVDWAEQYAWLSARQRRRFEPMVERIAMPTGYERAPVPDRSFAAWLRHLPMASEGTPVTTVTETVVLAADHPNLAAVVALRPRAERLLNGVNILIRLRAEYCWTARRTEGLVFHFTSGHLAGWRGWSLGDRPFVDGRDVAFRRVAGADESRDSFCMYLETVFRYASLPSLLADTRPADDRRIEAGDILVQRGRPGHALMVLDIATDARGRLRVLLGQGGRPAQAFHVLRSDAGTAWFPFMQTGSIEIAGHGVFHAKSLRHWPRKRPA
jgi:hypothetical protein